MLRSFKYGRLLDDFEVGATYEHPWEVTVDQGMTALFQASFLDATPVYASAAYAREMGFRDRPLHPLLLLNLGLSFSVHDVSEQAIAHLAYVDVRFPNAAFAGDTLHAKSIVLDKRPTSAGDRGVVFVKTFLHRDDDSVVCSFGRRALVRAGGKLTKESPRPPLSSRAAPPEPFPRERASALGGSTEMREFVRIPKRARGFAGFAEDFHVGDVIVHDMGRTIAEAEHMQLTDLVRNSHPLHLDEVYCKEGGSFAGTRVVYGGLVFAWVATLASRDTSGNVLWDLGFDNGAHPNGVVAGDTLFAASKVLAVEPDDGPTARITFRLVGTKNVRAAKLLEQGVDPFAAELGKKEDKVAEKVFEIDRTVLMRKHP